jgi:4'-phosphopantetheinyl transferase
MPNSIPTNIRINGMFQQNQTNSVLCISQPEIKLRLTHNEIHLWSVSLKPDVCRAKNLLSVLSPDERERMDRFCFPKDKDRFIIARGTLRTLLSHYIGIGPSDLLFKYGYAGKPSLTCEVNPNDVRFNLTHSNDIALFAFSIGRELGVDIEYIHPDPVADQVAERFFSEKEVFQFKALPENERERAFFKCWTRKEAYIKAIGSGLCFKLDQFSVSFVNGVSPALVEHVVDPRELVRWSISAIESVRGYVGALVYEGSGCCVKLLHLNP